MNHSALLLGASGLVGGHCLNLLLEDDHYDLVRIFVRKELPIQHKKLQQRVVDFDQLEYYAEQMKVNDIYCCLGTTIKKAGSQDNFYKVDFTYPFEVSRIAIRQGVEQFLIVTAMGASPQSKVFYNRVKGNIEEALAKLNFRTLMIFRPSFLLGHRPETRTGERIGIFLFRLFSFLLIGRWRKFRAIPARTVAEAMITMAKLNLQGTADYNSDAIQLIVDAKNSVK